MIITTEEALDQALAEMGRLEGELKTLQTACNAEIEVVKRRYQLQAICNGDSGLENIPDRLKALEEAALTYGRSHLTELFPDPKKSKSKALTHGTIGIRKVPLSVIDAPEGEQVRKSVATRLITAVISALGKIVLFGVKTRSSDTTVRADRLFNVTIAVNRDAVKELVNKQQLTVEQLAELGLALKGGEGCNEVWIKPAAVAVSPHSNQPSQVV